MKGFDQDTLDLFKKRVIDIAGCSPKDVRVKLMGKIIPVSVKILLFFF